jgi:hypothetical protein
MLRLTFAAILLLAQIALADTTTTRPMPGILLERDVQTDPPMRIFAVTVDLTNPHIHLKVSRAGSDWSALPRPWEVKLMTVSEMAQRDGLGIAINGNLFECRSTENIMGVNFPYFWGNMARACGWAMSDGKLFSGSPADITWPSLMVNDQGQVTIGRLDRIPLGARQIVSGIWQIVTDGRMTTGIEPTRNSAAAPHAAVGIDRDGKTLTLFIVDGRRPTYSVGMSWNQVARQMLDRGAWNALLLDGGGSTTLVMRNPAGKADVVNLPSDGHDLPGALSIQRCVANALGVVIDGAATQP